MAQTKLNNSQLPDTISSKTIDNTNDINTTTTKLKISGGTNGQVLTTDGASNLSWTTVSGGGGGSFPTTETISSGVIDVSKTTTFITGNNVTLPAGNNKGDIKILVKDNSNVTTYLNYTSSTMNSCIVNQSTGIVYVYGSFSQINNIPGTSKIAQYNPATNTWSSVGGGMTTGIEIYRAYFDISGNLWVCGDFTNIGGTPCSNIAYWNGTSWVAGNVGTINGQVRALILDTANVGNYWMCGNFTTANSVTVNRFAYFNGTTYVGYGTGISNNIAFDMKMNNTNSDIYITGSFTSVNSISNTSGIVRFSPSSNTFSSVSSGTIWVTSGTGYGLHVENDTVIIAGQFNINSPSGTQFTTPYWNGSTWLNYANNQIGGGSVRNVRKLLGKIYFVSQGSRLVYLPALLNTNSNININTYSSFKYNPSSQYLEPFYGTIGGTWDIDYSTVNSKIYAVDDQALLEIDITNACQVTTSGTKIIFNLTRINNTNLNTEFSAIQFLQKGSSIILSWNGTNWVVINTISTNSYPSYLLIK